MCTLPWMNNYPFQIKFHTLPLACVLYYVILHGSFALRILCFASWGCNIRAVGRSFEVGQLRCPAKARYFLPAVNNLLAFHQIDHCASALHLHACMHAKLARYLVTTVAWLALQWKFYECSAGKGFMQWELILEQTLIALNKMFYKHTFFELA